MADHCEMCAETYDSKFQKHMTQNYKWTYTVFYILYFLIPILKWFLKLLKNKNLKCVKCICINLTLLWKSISKLHYNQLPSEVTSKEVFSEETKIEILGLSSKCYMWWKPKNAHCPEHTICKMEVTPSSRTITLNIQSELQQNGIEWTIQSPDPNQIEKLWQDLKTGVHW